MTTVSCEDIDSVDPLGRLPRLTEYRREDVQAAPQRAREWILSNFNPDGGAVFRRGSGFHYGTATI